MIDTDLLMSLVESRGLKLQKIADVLGITRQSLNNKIKGIYPFTLAQAYELSDLLGVRGTATETKIFCPSRTQKVSDQNL